MDAVPLDPAGYGGTYKLVGGRRALDLVNTISWPDSARRHDWFDPPGNITAWLEAVGLEPIAVPAEEVDAVANVRAAIAAVVRPLARSDRPMPEAVAAFNELLGRAGARRRLDHASLAWTWPRPTRPREAFDPVLCDAADLLATGNHDRLKHCPSCHWLFYDRTRNGRRRWCDMADCGSRAKARAYYQRTRPTP